jgi:hypothetical protein
VVAYRIGDGQIEILAIVHGAPLAGIVLAQERMAEK